MGIAHAHGPDEPNEWPTWKVVTFGLLGLLIPLLAVVFLGPKFISENSKTTASSIAEASSASRSTSDSPASEINDQSSSYAVISSDPHLDPESGKTFLISVSFRFDALPPVGTRLKIVSKYDSSTMPYPGWAIGIARQVASTRPVIYWRDTQGKGDWFYFDDLIITPGARYVLTVVVNPGKSLALFGGHAPIGVGDEPASESQSGSESAPSDSLRFLGAYEAPSADAPVTKANLYFGARGAHKSFFDGDVSSILMASGFTYPKKRPAALKLFSLTPDALRSHLQENEIALYVSGKGKDESPYSRTITYRDHT